MPAVSMVISAANLCPCLHWQEVMFMGNGEQYIWKPPEDDDMLMHQNKALVPMGAHTVENIQPSAAVVRKHQPALSPDVQNISRHFILVLLQTDRQTD